MNNFIKLEKEKRDRLISEVKTYFLMERDEDLGDLAAELILDFFIEKLGKGIYNQGVADSYKCMSEKVEDLLEIQR